MTRHITTLATIFLLLGCGKQQVTCTVAFDSPVAVTNTWNNFTCPVNQVLVGYDSGRSGGPLLCSSMTITCPVQDGSKKSAAADPLYETAE